MVSNNKPQSIISDERSSLHQVWGSYLLIVPASCGRPEPYDDTEFERSANALRLVADLFLEHNVKAAIEPIRSAETSIVHTINDAKRYIDEVNHPGVKHINGDHTICKQKRVILVKQ